MKTKEIWDFVKRHALWIVAGVLALSLILAVPKILSFFAFCIAMEAIAIGLSNLAQYAYTKMKFDRISLSDNEINQNKEYESNIKATTAIFLAVHLLMAFNTLIFYSDTFK